MGIDEARTKMFAREIDNLGIRWRGGRAWIDGNDPTVFNDDLGPDKGLGVGHGMDRPTTKDQSHGFTW